MTTPTATVNQEPILVRQEGTTLVVSINRAEAMNALNKPVLDGLAAVIDWIEANNAQNAQKFVLPGTDVNVSQVRAMILTGTGEKAFVAGADIKQFEGMSTDAAVAFAQAGQKLFTRLEKMKIPVIAAVNGFALGGGLELALACDFILASDNAKFGLPECTLGLMPGFGGTVRLPRRIGPAKARELTFTGGMISAPEALELGLVSRVVAQSELLVACLEIGKTIASRAPVAVAMIKKSIHEGMSLSEEKANELEARLFGDLFATQDKVEGVKAFLEKRKPAFRGN